MSKEMKESNIPWVGNIPYAWHTKKIKYLADSTQENSFMDGDWIESPYITDVGIRYYTTGNIGDGVFKEQGNGYISQDTFEKLNCKYAYPDDFVIARLNTPFGRACILPNGSDKYVLAVDIVILRTKENKKYLNYLMQCEGYHAAVGELARGTTMLRISRSNLGNIHLPIPPRTEQDTIVKYLDKYCNAIDSSISRHQQIIEKLEEYRKSVITQAVTKGLDPNAEMKDSGNHLLGNIPADWVMKRLRNVAAIVRGGSPRPIDQYITDGDGYNWIKIGDATGNGKYITSTKQKIIKEGLSKTRIVNPGTLLLTNSMSFGHPYILQITGCIHDGWLAFSDYREMIPEYLYYYLMAEPTMVQFKSSVDGSVVQNLNIDKVKNAIIVCPSLTEQKAIVSYLDTVGGQVDESIKKHAEIIEKLKEYKQSIIYNAVTGKIDCRVTE